MPAPLNPDEVSALMSAIEEGRVEPSPLPESHGHVVSYDLTSQDRIIRGQMPTLDSIYERAASLFAVAVAGRTRLRLEIASSPATLVRFSDVGALLSPPSVVAVMTLGPGSGNGLVILDANVADPLLAAALGDRKARPPEAMADTRRDMTAVEKLVMRRLISLLAKALAESFEGTLPFRPEVLRFETDPRLALLAPPNELAVMTTLEVSGAINGRMQLVVPYTAIEPAKKQLAATPRPGGNADERFARAMQRELMETPVELKARLGRARMTLAKLLELNKGDLLVLDSDESQPINVEVQGRDKLRAQPHVTSGSMSVVIDAAIGA